MINDLAATFDETHATETTTVTSSVIFCYYRRHRSTARNKEKFLTIRIMLEVYSKDSKSQKRTQYKEESLKTLSIKFRDHTVKSA
jgi:hypothetical protein